MLACFRYSYGVLAFLAECIFIRFSFSLYLISCLKVYLTLYRGLYSMVDITSTFAHNSTCTLILAFISTTATCTYTHTSTILFLFTHVLLLSLPPLCPQFPLLSLSTLYIYFSLNPYVYLCRIYSKYFLILSERAEESHLSVCHLFHSKKTALTDTCQQPVGLLAVNSVIWLDRSA